MAHFDCFIGDRDIDISINGNEDDCIEAVIEGSNSLSLFYNPGCESVETDITQTSDEQIIEEIDMVPIFVVTIILLVVIIVICVLVVIYVPFINQIVFPNRR